MISKKMGPVKMSGSSDGKETRPSLDYVDNTQNYFIIVANQQANKVKLEEMWGRLIVNGHKGPY